MPLFVPPEGVLTRLQPGKIATAAQLCPDELKRRSAPCAPVITPAGAEQFLLTADAMALLFP